MKADDTESERQFHWACERFWAHLQDKSVEAFARLQDSFDRNAPDDDKHRPAPLGWVP